MTANATRGRFSATNQPPKREALPRCWCAEAGPSACPVHSPGEVQRIVGDWCVTAVRVLETHRDDAGTEKSK